MLVALYHTTTIYTDPRLTTRLRTTKSILSIEELRQEVFRLGLDVFTEQVVADVVGIVEGVLDRVHVLFRLPDQSVNDADVRNMGVLQELLLKNGAEHTKRHVLHSKIPPELRGHSLQILVCLKD